MFPSYFSVYPNQYQNTERYPKRRTSPYFTSWNRFVLYFGCLADIDSMCIAELQNIQLGVCSFLYLTLENISYNKQYDSSDTEIRHVQWHLEERVSWSWILPRLSTQDVFPRKRTRNQFSALRNGLVPGYRSVFRSWSGYICVYWKVNGAYL